MGLVDQRSKQVDAADLAIMAVVETIRDQEQPATASAVCTLIGGAPQAEVGGRLGRMWQLSLLDVYDSDPPRYRVTQLGAEVLARDLVGWSPSTSEQRRRDEQMRSSTAGALRLPR